MPTDLSLLAALAGSSEAVRAAVSPAWSGRRIDATDLTDDARFRDLSSGPLRPCLALSFVDVPTWVEVGVPVPDAGPPVDLARRLGTLFVPDGAGGGRVDAWWGARPRERLGTARWRPVAGAAGVAAVDAPAGSHVLEAALQGGLAVLRNLNLGVMATSDVGGREAVEVVARPAPPPGGPAVTGYCMVIDEDRKAARVALVREYPPYAMAACQASYREALATAVLRGRDVPGRGSGDEVAAVASVLATLEPDAQVAPPDALNMALPLMVRALGVPSFAVRRKGGSVRVEYPRDTPAAQEALGVLADLARHAIGTDDLDFRQPA